MNAGIFGGWVVGLLEPDRRRDAFAAAGSQMERTKPFFYAGLPCIPLYTRTLVACLDSRRVQLATSTSQNILSHR